MAPRVARAAWAAVPGHWPRAAPSPDHVSTCSKAPRADTARPTLPADAETNTAVPSHRHPHGLGPGLCKRRGIEHEHAIGLSQLLCNLADQLLAQGGVIPLCPTDEALERQALLAKSVCDRFHVFAFHVRQQATDIGAGMLMECLTAQGFDKGFHKGVQARQDLLEDRGGDLTFFE